MLFVLFGVFRISSWKVYVWQICRFQRSSRSTTGSTSCRSLAGIQ